jgi:riboflavin kinase/FMN adenylyltransferase
MELDTSLILAFGDPCIKADFYCDEPAYRKAELDVIEAIIPPISEGASLQDIFLSASYEFPRALADSKRLTELMSAHGLDSVIMAEEVYRGRTLSTTEIKSALKEGRTDEAAEMLGYPYFRDSSVERGEGMGRKLGFPTVNSSLSSETEVLRSGVYRSAVMIDGRIYNAVTNVGTCPTFAERERHCETFIIDYSGNLYGKKIRTFFLGYLREEKRFEDKNDLILQINVDKNRAIKENGDIKWLEAGLN